VRAIKPILLTSIIITPIRDAGASLPIEYVTGGKRQHEINNDVHLVKMSFESNRAPVAIRFKILHIID
jgi:hypothetical protein